MTGTALPAASQPSVPSELVARLEAASVGSRELDALIWPLHPGFKRQSGQHYTDEALEREWRQIAAPDYTTSLDAALALAERVLPGVRVVTDSACKETGRPAAGFVFSQQGEKINGVMNDGATVALALCASILKASTAGSNKLGGDEGRKRAGVNQNPGTKD